MKLVRLLLAPLCFLAGLVAGATPGLAVLVCVPTMDDVLFGTVDMTTNTVVDLTFNFQVSCTGGGANQRIRICPSIGSGTGGANGTGSQRFMLNGATQLAYNLYSNAARTTVWGSYFWGLPPTPPTINLRLNGAGNGTVNTNVYARIFSGQTSKPSGFYSSSFTGSHTLISYNVRGIIGTCSAADLDNATTSPFIVSATNDPSCTVSASNLTFPDTGFLDTAVAQTSTINVTCPSTLPYRIALDGGLSGASDPTQRKLTLGAEEITYGLYRDNAYALPWGSTAGVNTAAGTGTGVAQGFTVYGRIPAQTTPTPGIYDDTIVVTVTY